MDSKSEKKLSRRQSFRKRWKLPKACPLRSRHHAVPRSTDPEESRLSPSPRVSSGPGERSKPETKNDTASVLVQASEPVSLWDEAYELLKIEKPSLLSDYESLLSRVVAEDTNDLEDAIPQYDRPTRQQKLEQIAKLGFERMQEGKLQATFFGKKIVLQEAIGTLGNGISWVQTYAKDALKDVPYAPAVMACTSLVLPLLTSPSRVDDENKQGLLYVTSQIRYYIEMETLLLADYGNPGVKAQLKEQVKGLYKLVIDYQVQSVMRFHRNPTKDYFRSVTGWDGWSEQLTTIKEEEKTLTMRFQGALSGLNVQKLNDLEREAEHSRKALEDVVDYTRKIEKQLSDVECRDCLNTLKATDPQLDKQRIERFKGGLLKDSYHWVIENQDFKRWINASSGELLWIKGGPGKGKTMLVCGIIDELPQLAAPDKNIAFFFCQATVETLNNSPAVLRGLISMLVKQQPSLMSHLSEGSFDGHNAWFALQNTLTNILNDPTLKPTYLLIDALDECIKDRQNLLDLLVEHSSAHENIKWIVSSRNLREIERDLNRATQMKLHLELNKDVLSKTIHSFIEYRVQKLENRSDGSEGKTDIWKAVKEYLVANASGTFLWVALVCEYLAKRFYWEIRERLKDFPPDLDNIYKRMMSQIIDSDKSEICKSILRVTTTVLRPITLDEMMVYVDIPGDDERALKDLVGLCGSFLSVQDNTIFLIHQSAKDFIMDKASSEIFPNGKGMIHYNLFSNSLRILGKDLRRDIYNLRAPGYPIQEVKVPNPDPLRAVRYGCVYWVDHLVSCGTMEDTTKATEEERLMDSFLSQSYLHWLEAMSILKSVPSGIASMQKLEKFIRNRINADPESLVHRVRDAIRFVQYTKVAIERSPLQVYYSSLIYSPMQSITRECYHGRQSIKDWIRIEPVVESCWSPCLQTLESHTDRICSLAWSQDGNRLASGAFSSTRIWDLDTSECMVILEDTVSRPSNFPRWHPSRGVMHIRWLNDNRVASISECTIKVWSLDTRQPESIFEESSYGCASMAWSDNQRQLAFASDKSIRILDLDTNNWVSIPEGHTSTITSIAWSPSEFRLASGSKYSDTIRVWDLRDMECVFILESYSDCIWSLAWSPDERHLAAGSSHTAVNVWDTKTRDYVSLQGHISGINSVAWSSEGSRLASGSDDSTIRVWDVHTMECIFIFEGHRNYISSLAWSPDGTRLASGSQDMTIKIWGTTAEFQSISRRYDEIVDLITWSPDGSRLVSFSRGGAVRVWNPTTGVQLSIFGLPGIVSSETDYISEVAWSQDGNQLASGWGDGTIRVWNPSTGEQLSVCNGHTHYITDLAFSPDGGQLASGSGHGTVRIWDPTTGRQLSICERHTYIIHKLAWSPDGSQLASVGWDGTIQVWNPTTGSQLSICRGHLNGKHITLRLTDVTWSPNGSQLASVSVSGRVQVWNPTTGAQFSIFEGHYKECEYEDKSDFDSKVAWSPDGRQLASVSHSKVVVSDPTTGRCILNFPVTTSGFLRFDSIDPNYLHTRLGTFDLRVLKGHWKDIKGSNQVPKTHGYGLSEDLSWITYDGGRVLWLPPDHRPQAFSAFALSTLAVAISCASGAVKFLEFSKLNPLTDL